MAETEVAERGLSEGDAEEGCRRKVLVWLDVGRRKRRRRRKRTVLTERGKHDTLDGTVRNDGSGRRRLPLDGGGDGGCSSEHEEQAA